MNRIHISLVAAIALFLSGCWWPGIRGNGHIVTDKRPVTEFSDIQGEGSFEIEWHSGPPSLSITTDENLVPDVHSRVDGKTLRLDSRERIWPTHGIKVAVTTPALTGVSITGAVRLTATQVTGPKFYLETTGASRVTLDGSVDELLADMTGATKLMAAELHTKNARISSSGASKAEVYASETLRVEISGAGKVTYYGHPKKVEREISGAGSIRPGD
jgi:putative autotransporter adhesin-like protein